LPLRRKTITICATIAISATIAIITIMIAITSGTIMTIITIMIIMIIIVVTTITKAEARKADDRTLLLRGTGADDRSQEPAAGDDPQPAVA
jgi:hypothetical protein